MTFQLKRTQHLPILRAVASEYEDVRTGARHIHLDNQSDERVFLVAFATLPTTSDGSPHILEHIALCGSRRYPVRDPFFAMARRSVATFMNAFTYADRTVYPVASTNPVDFANLVDVYLSSAFEPTLHYLDFLQEGWRHEFAEGRLSYGGVVFNEMKGAYVDPTRALEAGIAEHLLAGTPYAFDSGGDPLVIPSLQYEALKQFWQAHYHPSRAIFMTAGNVDVTGLQATIVERVLDQCAQRLEPLLPQLAADWPVPREAEVKVPCGDTAAEDFGFQFAWRLGPSTDLYQVYCAHLLEAGLIGDSSTPLLRVMESSGFGRPSGLNGLDLSARQMVFHAGMEGLTRAQVQQARQLMWNALEQAATEGVPFTTLEATLRDIRFEKREISGGRMPHGLQVLLEALPLGVHGGDMMAALDVEPVLQRLDKEIRDPAYFKNMVASLLDCNNRLDAVVLPDPHYFSTRQQAEDASLARREAQLNAEERAAIERDTLALQARQREPVNKDLLPRIRPSEVRPDVTPAVVVSETRRNIALPADTNGIGYASVSFDLSASTPEDWQWLNFFGNVLPELGLGKMGYEEASAWRQDRAPRFKISLDSIEHVEHRQSLRVRLVFFGKGLEEQARDLCDLFALSIAAPRFDEHERLAFLIESEVKDMENDLAEEGDAYAAHALLAPLTASGQFEETISGSSSLPFYRQLYQQSRSRAGLQAIAEKLAQLHRRVLAAPAQVVTVGSPVFMQAVQQRLDRELPAASSPTVVAPALHPQPLRSLALYAESQVNHCFAAWSVPNLTSRQAPAFAVLAELLTNEFLHRVVREEGGAYGGSASYNEATGVFRMRSFRDPRMSQTYQAFSDAIDWVLAADLDTETVEEAIICVIQELDKPLSPYAQAIRDLRRQERGITDALRQSFRSGLLSCSSAELKEAARVLRDGLPSRAAFVGSRAAAPSGFEVVELARLIS